MITSQSVEDMEMSFLSLRRVHLRCVMLLHFQTEKTQMERIWWKICKSTKVRNLFLNSSDYRHIPDLDRYDHADLDDDDVNDEMDYQTRMAAEEEMNKRDRVYGTRRWKRIEDEDGISYKIVLSIDDDMEIENQAGEIAAHGRLGAEQQGAMISAPDDVLHDALKTEPVKNEIINRYVH